jgi:hypothetical protein
MAEPASPKQRLTPTERFLQALAAFVVLGMCASLWQAVADSKAGHGVVNVVRALTGADQRVINVSVWDDSIVIVQHGSDSLKNCMVTVNDDFAYQAGVISPELSAIFPLREFALESGLRFDAHRYKVNDVHLYCVGLSRSLTP